MSDNSHIQWTEATWNFLIGCLKKSLGCMNCYAIRQAWRMMHNPNPKIAKKFEGTVARDSKGALNWTGRINFDEDTLTLPLKWREPRRIFVNSLSDLFHPNVKDEWINAAFAVMALCPQHTFQILTKHPDRAVQWFNSSAVVWEGQGDQPDAPGERKDDVLNEVLVRFGPEGEGRFSEKHILDLQDDWPLPNVWLGTSVEDQQTANERIPLLLETPAAVRFLSCEPLLRPIDLRTGIYSVGSGEARGTQLEGIHWVIVGGESGPSARPCALEWIESIVSQCKAAGVPVFVKQLGAFVVSEQRTCDQEMVDLLKPHVARRMLKAPNGEYWAWRAGLADKKGGDISEFPPDLRVREYPKAKAVTA